MKRHENTGYWVGWSPPNNTNEGKTLARAHCTAWRGRGSMMHSALTDTVTLPMYEAELRWQQRQQIYEQILDRDSIALGDSLLTAFFDSCHAANMGMLDRATKARTEQHKPETLEVYLDTLNGMTTTILPEAALRDILIVLLEKDLDTTTVVDSVSYRLAEILNTTRCAIGRSEHF